MAYYGNGYQGNGYQGNNGYGNYQGQNVWGTQAPFNPASQVQQNQPQSQPIYYTSRIWVNGKSEVDFYPVAPNNAVDLWDRNGTTLYQKKADATGKPSVTVYDVIERAESSQDGSKSEGVKDMPYATKEDVAALAGVVKGFDGMIASMKGEIEKMSGDLYGIAGSKKKSTKKVESEEESE